MLVHQAVETVDMTFSDVNDGKFKKSGGFTGVFQYTKYENYNYTHPAADEVIRHGWMPKLEERHYAELLRELRTHRRLVDHRVSLRTLWPMLSV